MIINNEYIVRTLRPNSLIAFSLKYIFIINKKPFI